MGLPYGHIASTTTRVSPERCATVFPLLDCIRAIATLGVFLYHADHLWPLPELLRPIASHGNAGVPVFFALSGFLIYRPFVLAENAHRRVAVARFYKRRALRIVPAYWFALSILAVFPGLPLFGDRWWQLYLFGQGFDPETVFGAGIGAAWSLCIEVTFYLLLPAYALMIGKLLGRGAARWWYELPMLAGLAVLTLLVHMALAGAGSWEMLSFTLPGTFYLFALGMMMAIVSVRTTWLDNRVVKDFPGAFWAVALCLYVGVSYAVPAESLGSVHPVYGLIAAFVLVPAIVTSKSRLLSMASWGVLRWLGLISYAFYLWHYAVLQVIGERAGSSLGLVLAAFAVTCGISTFSYFLVEKPFMPKRRTASTPAARTPVQIGSTPPR